MQWTSFERDAGKIFHYYISITDCFSSESHSIHTPRDLSQPLNACFYKKLQKNLRFIKLAALLIILGKTVTSMYVNLAVLVFLQRKSMYGFFLNSESHPSRRLCKSMVVCHEKKKSLATVQI